MWWIGNWRRRAPYPSWPVFCYGRVCEVCWKLKAFSVPNTHMLHLYHHILHLLNKMLFNLNSKMAFYVESLGRKSQRYTNKWMNETIFITVSHVSWHCQSTCASSYCTLYAYGRMWTNMLYRLLLISILSYLWIVIFMLVLSAYFFSAGLWQIGKGRVFIESLTVSKELC